MKDEAKVTYVCKKCIYFDYIAGEKYCRKRKKALEENVNGCVFEEEKEND